MHAVRYRWLKDLRLKVFSPSENTGVMYKAGPVPTPCAAIAGDGGIVPKLLEMEKKVDFVGLTISFTIKEW